jgi:hypothetical protein
MQTDSKIHVLGKAAPPVTLKAQEKSPSFDFDVIASSIVRKEEYALGASEDVERQGTGPLIFFDASQSAEEDPPQHITALDYDLNQFENFATLKWAGTYSLVTIPVDISSRKYPSMGLTPESPDTRITALSVGGKLKYGRMHGTPDLLSALSKAQRTARRTSRPEPTPADRARFRELANRWVRETEGISVHSRAVMHKAYQQIIGMGPVAIALLLEALQDQPDHWMWALAVLTDEDPAKNALTFPQAQAAWLNWGREKGYLGE